MAHRASQAAIDAARAAYDAAVAAHGVISKEAQDAAKALSALEFPSI